MNDEKKSYFLIYNNFVLDEVMASLSGSALKVYIALMVYRNHQTGECFPSYSLIKQKAGLSSNASISSAIKELKKLNLVEIISKGNSIKRCNRYRVNYYQSTQKMNRPAHTESDLVQRMKATDTTNEQQPVQKVSPNYTNRTIRSNTINNSYKQGERNGFKNSENKSTKWGKQPESVLPECL